MDDNVCRDFFLRPADAVQRHYEAMRAFFVDGHSWKEVAERFGFEVSSLKSMASRFRAEFRADRLPPFFASPRGINGSVIRTTQ